MVASLIDNLEEVKQSLAAYRNRLKPYYADAPDAPLWMACLAAFPIAVNIELMYQLWANFKHLKGLNDKEHTLPVLVVSDCILSSLWRETGTGVFEMNTDMRAYLLETFRDNFGKSLNDDLASFLYKYVRYKKSGDVLKNFYDAQEWTAILAVDAQQAAASILGSLVNTLRPPAGNLKINDGSQSIGISNLIATLVKANEGLAEVIRQALDKKEEAIIEKQPNQLQLKPGKKSLVVKSSGPGTGISIDLPADVSSRLMPLFKAGSVQTFTADMDTPEQGTVYSLVVALNEFKELPRLNKSVIDANTFVALLEGKKLVTPANQTKLYDREATYESVNKHLEDILEKATEWDTVVFYYCGRGTYEENQNRLHFFDSGMPNAGSAFNTISNLQFQQKVSGFAHNNPTIVVVLDSCHTGSRSWLDPLNPKHYVLMASQAEEQSFENESMTDSLVAAFNNSRENLTYKNIYRYLLLNLKDQIPQMVVHKDFWDYYFLTPIQEDLVVSEQKMLTGLGYSLFTDGKDSPQWQEARNDFKNKYDVSSLRGIPIELRKAVLFKNRSQINVAYIQVADPSGGGTELARIMEQEQVLLKKHRADMHVLQVSGYDAPNKRAMVNAIITNDVLLMGLNRIWVNQQAVLTILETILDMAYVLDRWVYFVIEEECDWKKPPVNAYVVLPYSLQPVTKPGVMESLLQDLDPILSNLGKYLKPEHTAADDPAVVLLIRQAGKTKQLDLSNLSLLQIPEAVFTIKGLQTLNLSNNRISVIPAAIGQLENIAELNLSNNPVQILPDEIEFLDELVTLDLSHTSLEILPGSFGKLSALRNLRIDDSKINIIDVTTFMQLHLDVFSYQGVKLLNFETTSAVRLTQKDFADYFSSTHSEECAIIEIHSEIARPHFNTIPAAVKNAVHYAFFSGIDTLPQLFTTICHQLTDKNNIVYICDEKNILSPQFGADTHRQMRLHRYFKAFGKQLNLIINNPQMDSVAFADLGGAGTLNFAAVRNDKPVSGKDFTTLFFENIWKTVDPHVIKRIFLTSTFRSIPEKYRQLMEALGKAGYEVWYPAEFLRSGHLAQQDIQAADMVLLIISSDEKAVSEVADEKGQQDVERDYDTAIQAVKPVIILSEKLNKQHTAPWILRFAERVIQRGATEYFTSESDLSTKALRAVSYVYGAGRNLQRTSLLDTLKKISNVNTGLETGYNVYTNYGLLKDFTLPLSDAEINTFTASGQPVNEEAGLANQPITQSFKNKWVLVVGTGGKKITNVELLACQAIGKMLAREGYGLITGGWPGVDENVSGFFSEALKSLGWPEMDAALQVLNKNQKTRYQSGKVVSVRDDNEWYVYTLKKAFAVIMIGGEGGTYDAFKRAQEMEVPVIPLPHTDGDARKAYKELVKLKDYLYATTVLMNIDAASRPGKPENEWMPAVQELLLQLETRNVTNSTVPDFRTTVEALYKEKNMVVPGDLQKGRWGGQAERNGKRLSATVTTGGKKKYFKVVINVEGVSLAKFIGEVAFFLHNSFSDEIRYEFSVKKMAQLELEAYEAFTVGAYTEDGTMLELDLNEVPGYPKGFYYDDISRQFRVDVKKIYESRPVTVKDDLQKNRWGGKSIRDGKELTAIVTEAFIPGYFKIVVQMVSENSKKTLTGGVAFFLDGTFANEIVYRKVKNGISGITITAYEAFTVGAYTEDGTMLELDLQQLKGLPEKFYYK